jgi:hypothetical protein
MDEYPRMLYRAAAKAGPGTEPVHGGHFSLLTVSDFDALSVAINDGWSLTTGEAIAAQTKAKTDAEAALAAKIEDANAQPTRAELQQKADELGIKVDGRWSDRKLRDVISAALGA